MANWFQNDYEKTSSVAILYFHNKNYKAIKKFRKPVHLHFQIHDRELKNKNIIQGKAQNPKNVDDITLYRVSARNSKPIIVELLDLKESDKFEVLLTDFRKPIQDDLKRTINISKNNKFVTWNNDHDYDSFQYLAIFSAEV